MKLMKKTLVILSCLYVVSCDRIQQPPRHHITEKPYTIFGSKYYPQTTYDYDKVGYASWYGENDHGKPTATGVTFNKYSMTAAHRTLPLPSVVKVTNLENNRSVVLLVNDRGPFAKTNNRIIDVSEAAAKKLGFHKNGMAKVRVQCLRDKSVVAALSYNKTPYAPATYKHYAMVNKLPELSKNRGLSYSKPVMVSARNSTNRRGDYISFNTISDRIKALFGIKRINKASVAKKTVRSSLANRIMY